MEDLVDGLNDKVIQDTHFGQVPLVNGKNGPEPLDLEKARGRITLKTVGDGRYWIFLGNDYAVDKDGERFELDLKEIEERGLSGESEIDLGQATRDSLRLRATGRI